MAPPHCAPGEQAERAKASTPPPSKEDVDAAAPRGDQNNEQTDKGKAVDIAESGGGGVTDPAAKVSQKAAQTTRKRARLANGTDIVSLALFAMCKGSRLRPPSAVQRHQFDSVCFALTSHDQKSARKAPPPRPTARDPPHDLRTGLKATRYHLRQRHLQGPSPLLRLPPNPSRGYQSLPQSQPLRDHRRSLQPLALTGMGYRRDHERSEVQDDHSNRRLAQLGECAELGNVSARWATISCSCGGGAYAEELCHRPYDAHNCRTHEGEAVHIAHVGRGELPADARALR
jgi:hypothetical protein